ncbi:hypothetical protein EJ110_NYTH03065 [Nymphaea thermarum]|nr:hypothetical protein EJ110_NYTH03065 [Nymphaea thermarum]
MSSPTNHVPALLACFIFLFSHCLLNKDCRHVQARKYYPDEPPIKTIVLDNGDVIDCVDFYSQPAMKHPFVRRNPQLRAKFPLQRATAEENTNDNLEGIDLRRGRCPQGSVPFLKATKAGPLNLSAINDFKRSSANFVIRSKTIKTEMNMEKDHENNSYVTRLYCDNIKHPRYNNQLQFVRYNSNYMAIGSKLGTSVNEGEQKVLQIKIEKNTYGNWDLSVDSHMIGYWPHENYGDGFPVATELQWGGEIVNKQSKGRHTSTQMGSGLFSKEAIGKAAFISNIGLFDKENKYSDAPEEPDGIITHPDCYDLTYWERDAQYGRYITMGGPGYDEDRCP